MIEADIDKLFSEHAAAIKDQGHDFNFAIFQNRMKDLHQWADGGLVRTVIEKKKLDVLGEAPAKTEGKKPKPKPVAKPVAAAEEKKRRKRSLSTSQSLCLAMWTLVTQLSCSKSIELSLRAA